MKTSGLVAVLVSASAVEAFVPAPSASSALRTSSTKAGVGRQSRVQQRGQQQQLQYMVAAPAAEGTVAAVPHGGTLIDLNLKTDEEKKVGPARLVVCICVYRYVYV